MKSLHKILFSMVLGAGLMNAQKADLIVTNGKITTMDDKNPEVQAVAIKDHKIFRTGTNAQILKLKGSSTKLIDAKGNRVIPGLFDSHLHVIRGGRFYNTELRWDGVKTLKRALEMLKEQAQRTPKGQWVRVIGGWNEYQFEEKRLPTLAEINEATGEVPTFVMYLYGKAWLNKAGLKELNINGDTPNPSQGLIEKDSNGDPTGLLVAEPNAFILYSTLAKLPELSEAEKENSTLQYMTELNRLGVTAVMDAGGGFQNFPDDYGTTDALNKQGKITVRLPYYLFAQKKGSELSDYTKWTGMVDIDDHGHNGHNEIDYHVNGGGENLVSDGADFENFLFPRPELPATMEKNMKDVVSLLVKKRWPFRIHATYNESITRFLNVIEEVNRETPLNGLVWFIDHAETVSEENMKRIKTMGGGIAVQHRMAYQGESFIHRYGKKAALASPPVKKMLEMGIPVGLGTDGTRVASYNPWVALYWVTSGKTLGGTQVMAKENALDRKTALSLSTFGGYELIKDYEKGKIKEGYFADLTILDRDYFSVNEEEIKDITSKLTIVDGKVVYGDQTYKHVAPASLPVLPEWSPVKYYGGYQTK
ncbi:amidohydrolase [Chryseobacterium indologenes]|uniref:amidohydrolase n=1 Tax=Chryseobacterium indologenes TaxID=253 RepID=UPI000BFC796C|nr:amidohydrolase [Chryseobacterium indologenes]ATN05836.1 amidohydrolase [Chryseobacterium indologenes]QIX82301.1 amidohydrolase [Chryseobacterium indologenes]UDQ56093.1 amidohydrolase [Chryseobacterium indologenes]